MNLGDPAWASEPPNSLASATGSLRERRRPTAVLGPAPRRRPVPRAGRLRLRVGARALRPGRGHHGALPVSALPERRGALGVVTMDIGLACFFVMTLYHEWRFVRGGGFAHLLGTVPASPGTRGEVLAVLLVPAVVILLWSPRAALLRSAAAAGSGETARSRLFDPGRCRGRRDPPREPRACRLGRPGNGDRPGLGGVLPAERPALLLEGLEDGQPEP